MKKTLLILVAVSTIFATACGDDSKPRVSDRGESKDCGSITEVGVCEGTVLKYCDDDELQVSDCAEGNKVCGLNSKEQYDCVESSDPVPGGQGGNNACGNITNTGLCEGTVLKYCDKGKLEVVDCATENKVCALDAQNYYNCLSSSSGGDEPCGSVTEKGLCEGNVLKYCDNGKLQVSNCVDGNKVCGLNSNNQYDCVESSGQGQTSGCGDITDVGVCDGAVLKFCNSNKVETVDCSKRSDEKKTCGMNVDTKKNDCIASSSSGEECSKLGENGKCVDGSVKWCSDNKIETASCSSFELGCGYNDGKMATCMDSCGSVTTVGECDSSMLKYCGGATKEDGKTAVEILYTYDCATDGKSCGKDSAGNYNCI